MNSSIRLERRPKLRRRSRQDQPEKSLDGNQINHLLEVIKCGAAFNPFGENLQIRNRLIILVLYSLGIRSGELLNIRISDINFSDSSLAIRRRADDKNDPRVKQPLVKTMERKLPLSSALAKELHN
ncbi:tyrosine-type recombinase/integrase [Enterobacter cloacae complex sp. 301C7]|uniref:tyrosine-type recombinase/integrase n=1 Tax=Enterobacter cloacae complex sp. 301C7 TaxID=3395848 RepID=UPI003CF9A2D3